MGQEQSGRRASSRGFAFTGIRPFSILSCIRPTAGTVPISEGDCPNFRLSENGTVPLGPGKWDCPLWLTCQRWGATGMAMLSMNETTTFRWSFEEDVARYAAAGIPAMGVWRQKLSDCGPTRPGVARPQRPEGLTPVVGGGIYRQRRPQLSRERGGCRRGPPHGGRAGHWLPGGLQRGPRGPYLLSCPATPLRRLRNSFPRRPNRE